MSEDSSVGPGLLKQNGLNSAERLEKEWRELERLLDADRKRANLVKWLAVGLLVLGCTCFAGFLSLALSVYRDYDPPPVRFLAEFVREGLPIVAACSVGLGIAFGTIWFFFARMVGLRAMKVRLASIELQLRSGGDLDRGGGAG